MIDVSGLGFSYPGRVPVMRIPAHVFLYLLGHAEYNIYFKK